MTTRNRWSDGRAPCLCGCGHPAGKTPGSNFKQTHDGKLVHIIVQGSKEERARVDWPRVLEVGFSSRRYDAEIRRLMSEDEGRERVPV